MRDEKVVRALHEPYDALLVNEQVAYPGFMASTHVKILEVFAFHEPSFRPRPPRSNGLASRTRTKTSTRMNWFKVRMHSKNEKGRSCRLKTEIRTRNATCRAGRRCVDSGYSRIPVVPDRQCSS